MRRRALLAAALMALAPASVAEAKKRAPKKPLVFVQFKIASTSVGTHPRRPTIVLHGELTYVGRGEQGMEIGATVVVPANLTAAKFRERVKAKVAADFSRRFNVPVSRVDVALV